MSQLTNNATNNHNDGGGGPILHRRSSAIRQSIRNKLHHSHFMSTLALCSSVFSMFFLLMNAFPYSGFMAMHLVPGLTEETAGPYAGLIASSFMVGRALSSYPWGKLADRYGRRFVLVVSLINATVFSLAFGMSTSLPMALIVRFLMGFGNGTMLVARVCVTELARGDKELEKRGMGLVMSMLGYGMLISPAIGGTLSEPLQQYPNSEFFLPWEGFLAKFPFFLPNVVGSLICLLSLFFVVISVEETLPEDKRREVKYIIPDMIDAMCNLCRRQRKAKDTAAKTQQYEAVPDVKLVKGHPPNTTIITSIVPALPSSCEEKKDDDDDYAEDEDIHILMEHQSDCDELSVLMATPASRQSYCSALHRPSLLSSHDNRPSLISLEEGQPLIDANNNNNTDETGEATIQSIWSKQTTRDHLISYWVNSFFNVAVNEAFPLFAMSKTGGLGWTETRIGGIGMTAGLLFCICQYLVFSRIMNHYSVQQSIRMGAFWSNLPVLLFPVSLLLPTTQYAFLFLSLLMAILMIFNSIFYATMIIATNRTVEAAHRGTMNGLSSVGASVGRGCGPIVAGTLVTLSMSPSSNALVPAAYGSIVLYAVLGLIGLASYWTTVNLKEEEDGDEDIKGTTN